MAHYKKVLEGEVVKNLKEHFAKKTIDPNSKKVAKKITNPPKKGIVSKKIDDHADQGGHPIIDYSDDDASPEQENT